MLLLLLKKFFLNHQSTKRAEKMEEFHASLYLSNMFYTRDNLKDFLFYTFLRVPNSRVRYVRPKCAYYYISGRGRKPLEAIALLRALSKREESDKKVISSARINEMEHDGRMLSCV